MGVLAPKLIDLSDHDGIQNGGGLVVCSQELA